MTYLVDASVLSEPTRARPDASVVEWLRDHEPDLAVDPIVLGEVRFAIQLLPGGRRRAALDRWFSEGVARLQCLPWGAETGLQWAELLATLRSRGRAMPVKDSMIAATALTHDLVMVTRNTTDFDATGLDLLDPFAG